MLKRFIIIVWVAGALTSCQSKAKSARDYNNNLIEKEKSLQPHITTVENNVKNYYAAGQYDSIAAAGEKMEKIVQKAIDDINAMKTPKANGVEDFKAAVIRYFKFIKGLYTDYKEYGLADTEEKRQQILQDIQEIVSKKQEILDDMQSAQKKFAEANHFRLESKPK